LVYYYALVRRRQHVMRIWRPLKWHSLLQIKTPGSTSRSIRVGCRKTPVPNATESEWNHEVSTSNRIDVIGRGAAVSACSPFNSFSSVWETAAENHWRVPEMVVCSSKTMCKVTSVSTMSPTTLPWTFSQPRLLPNPPYPCRALERLDWTTTPLSTTSISYIHLFNGFFYWMKTWSASVDTYRLYIIIHIMFLLEYHNFTMILQNWETITW